MKQDEFIREFNEFYGSGAIDIESIKISTDGMNLLSFINHLLSKQKPSEVSETTENILSHPKLESLLIDISHKLYSDLTTDSTYNGTWFDNWIKSYYVSLMSSGTDKYLSLSLPTYSKEKEAVDNKDFGIMTFRNVRMSEKVELLLKPKYNNDVFTWKQIQDAIMHDKPLKKVLYSSPINSNEEIGFKLWCDEKKYKHQYDDKYSRLTFKNGEEVWEDFKTIQELYTLYKEGGTK